MLSYIDLLHYELFTILTDVEKNALGTVNESIAEISCLHPDKIGI